MNKGAGTGDMLLLTLHLKYGDKLTFIMDTGAPLTVLDSSLVQGLGKQLGSTKITSMYGQTPSHYYQAPGLYLGDTRLSTGPRVLTMDLSPLSSDEIHFAHANHHFMGVLGLDCLRHYCIQLDFAARKIRFLDSNQLHPEDLGEAFPLEFSHGHTFVHENLVGIKGTKSLIDTGCNSDGCLTPKLFRQWADSPSQGAPHEEHRPNGVLGGHTYSHLQLNGDGKINALGLAFLARNLVTFDFPNQTMYLKRISAEPLLIPQHTPAETKGRRLSGLPVTRQPGA
jgi:hypothetical protein